MLFTDGRLLILALALTLVSLPACARDLIVDPGHPQSSDSNSGSPESPLKTIARSAELVQPGDRVIIKPGLYRESIPLKRSGAPGAPISFVAETPGTVVITGADPVANWTRLSGDAPIYRVPWPYQFIINHTKEGLPVEHHPEGEPVWGRAEQVIVDGKQLLPAGTLEALTKGWSENRDRPGEPGRSSAAVPDPADPATWHGMFAVDTTKKELYLWLQDGSDPNTHQVEAATRPSLFGLSPWQNPAGVHDVHLYGLVFRYGATFPQRAAVWLQGEDNLVEGCIIEHMAGSGLSVRGTVRHCVVRYNGQTGGGATGEGFLNEESLWEGNCWKPINRGWDAGGFKMARTKGGVFRRCAFLHNGGPGLWFDIHVENVLVTECVFDDNEGSGVFVEISRNITLLRNLCLRNGLRARGATWSEAGIKIAESMDCVVAHNTCVGNKDGITFRE
ncbi:right-handed parallel beta-helix repeat-containing protein, partial [bacterium]|nr:right-handed parallel beta-helix repeat-containing protein [bacterium]